MNSLGKYVLTKTQKIVLLVVVFALIAGGYYAGFYLPVQRRIEAADTAELDAQIQLEQMKAMQIRQMVEEIEENKASNAPMVPAYNHFKTETEELNRIFANAYDFTFQYSEPQVDGMEIRRAMNISFTASSACPSAPSFELSSELSSEVPSDRLLSLWLEPEESLLSSRFSVCAGAC